MNMQEVINMLSQANAEDVDRVMDAAIARRKVLFPDWEQIYLSVPKTDKEERRRILELFINKVINAC